MHQKVIAQNCLNNQYREWWDVQLYKYQIKLDIAEKSISGKASVIAKITGTPNDTLQIDLQAPLYIKNISSKQVTIHNFVSVHDKYYVTGDFKKLKPNDTLELIVTYEGTPKTAKNAPWDGGFVYDRDTAGNPWIAVACQGIGASVWLPCKDVFFDEPDYGVELTFTHPGNLQLIANGVFNKSEAISDSLSKTFYKVQNPINLYNITFYLGKYVHWTDTLQTIEGRLPIHYYALKENKLKATKHFREVAKTIQTFEYLYGPYPFANDELKIIEAPYLGMEHQGAIAYGNNYQMGYLGKDRSQSGAGMLFDFIIIHELGHEWFGNSLTASLPAYAWLQEGFTTYSEVQYLERNFGKDNSINYLIGKQKLIKNDFPLIDTTNLCNNLTTDQYDKGANIIHMIRLQINDDILFQQIIRKLLAKFNKQVVSSEQVETFLITESGAVNNKFFDQYLRTTLIPKLIIDSSQNKTTLHFENTVAGFQMILPIVDNNGDLHLINITQNKTTLYFKLNAATKKLWEQYLMDY